MHVAGGPVRTDPRVLREATALSRAGLAVSVVDVDRDSTCPRDEVIANLPTHHLIIPGWFVPTRFKPWFLIKLAQVVMRGGLKLLSTPADIYHAQDISALPACYIAARLRRKQLVYDAHEFSLVDPNVTRWRLLHALAVRILRHILTRSAGVITVSPPIAQEFQRRYGGPKPVVVRNIPEYRRPAHSDRLRSNLGLSSLTRIALYHGYLNADRGLDALVRSAAFLRSDVVVVMMGNGVMQPTLEALIAREGVQERVKLIPAVPHTELLDWVASADIGLILLPPEYSPSIRMCLPNKLFECLMAGVPVLASALDAVVDVIETYGVGSVALSLEPEHIANAIEAMLGAPDRLEQMRTNALAAAQQTLCWERESERLVALYQQILGDTRL